MSGLDQQLAELRALVAHIWEWIDQRQRQDAQLAELQARLEEVKAVVARFETTYKKREG
jgi:hypothetical protein